MIRDYKDVDDLIEEGPIESVPARWPRIAWLRLEWGNKCQECNRRDTKKSPLEFAHIKQTPVNGRGRGQTQRYYDILRHPDRYKLLCRPCHREFDKRGKANGR